MNEFQYDDEQCPCCKGDEACPDCHGLGEVKKHGAPGDLLIVECRTCGGDGYCPECWPQK